VTSCTTPMKVVQQIHCKSNQRSLNLTNLSCHVLSYAHRVVIEGERSVAIICVSNFSQSNKFLPLAIKWRKCKKKSANLLSLDNVLQEELPILRSIQSTHRSFPPIIWCGYCRVSRGLCKKNNLIRSAVLTENWLVTDGRTVTDTR